MNDLLDFDTPPLMALLPANLARDMVQAATLVTYQDGQLIHVRGETKPGLSIVHRGAVRVGTVGIDGSLVTITILGEGQSFGELTLFSGLPRTHDVSAVGKTQIYQINPARFERLFDQNPALAKALLITTLARSHHLLELLDDMRRLSLPVRAAKFIVTMSKSAVLPGQVRCTQAELAFALGVSRVSLGKALKRLMTLELISLGYGYINIPSLPALCAWVHKHNIVEPLTVSNS